MAEEKDVEILLNDANKNRSVASTRLNTHSSRSHCIYQLKIMGPDKKVRGALNLIDLAGSENIKDSLVTGLAQKEAIAINKHLSCLGDCISAIQKEAKNIPFRNSKLTLIL